ncbi:hypothetical protein FRX31_017267 [Thalictrum thalictroides]|uniref:Uncharacterized protein n=1 Tax=Thalictrum thalictroides TaxID=46969 RepID=A0A7J6W6W3_THATH|nr:hypothetical protein FRX31_017267 [Thalictrum thalictroides]
MFSFHGCPCKNCPSFHTKGPYWITTRCIQRSQGNHSFYRQRIHTTQKSEDYDKYSYAEAVWTGGDFTCLVSHHNSAFPPDGPDALDQALAIMQRLKDRSVLAKGNLWPQLGDVVDFINRKTYLSVEDLYTSIEQLFVDMLHITLAQLPAAIFKSLSDSSAEEFEDRVQLAMKFLFKTGCLEDIIRWWSPSEYNISSFVTDSDPSKKPLTGALAKLEGVVPKGLDKELMNGAQGV